MNLKKNKKRLFTARGHVDAMWHSGPRGSATRAHAAYILNIYFITIYSIRSSALPIWEGVFELNKPSGLINLTVS